MVSLAVAFVAMVLAAQVRQTSALYFLVVQGEERCFVEQVPLNTHVVVSYKK